MIIDFVGYSDALNELLAAHQLPCFRYILPLRIVKTFSGTILATLVLKPLSEFTLNYACESKDFSISLSSAIDSISYLGRRVQTFEGDMTSAGRQFPGYFKALADSFLDASEKSKFVTAIKQADASADAIIQSAFSSCSLLAEALDIILEDVKSSYEPVGLIPALRAFRPCLPSSGRKTAHQSGHTSSMALLPRRFSARNPSAPGRKSQSDRLLSVP